MIVRSRGWDRARDCLVKDDEDDDDIDEVFVIVLIADCSDAINTFLLTLTINICNN